MGSRRKQEEKDICCYVGESGENGMKDEFIQLMSNCILDKICSSSPDSICTVSDTDLEFDYTPVDWNTLRKVQNFHQSGEEADVQSDVSTTLSKVFDSIAVAEQDDVFRHKKILYFGNFTSELKKRKVEELVNRVTSGNYFLTLVVPNKTERSEMQEENVKLLTSCFTGKEELVSIPTLQDATVRLMNLASKKAVRPFPTNYELEIGPDLKIAVSQYLCIRKNKNSEIKQGLLKEAEKLPGAGASQQQMQLVPVDGDSSDALQPVGGDQDAELKSKITDKEAIWNQTDGKVIDAEDIVDGYYYGDKLVPNDEIDKSNQYQTGDKCLSVLLFCPKESIKVCHLVGDGSDMVFPRKDRPDAEITLKALITAMEELNRVAIVRKIRTNNAKLVIGVLSPDIKRNCLVFCELCFADDVSIPYFPPLFKGEISEEEELSPQDTLIDELIKCKSIETYTPAEGPVDPSIHGLREFVAGKILGTTLGSPALSGSDLFFKEIVNQVEENTLKQLKEAFPIKEIEEKGSERPAGQQVFRKRARELEAIENGGSSEKKPKDDDIMVPEPDSQMKDEINAAAEMFDPDNLLDDM